MKKESRYFLIILFVTFFITLLTSCKKQTTGVPTSGHADSAIIKSAYRWIDKFASLPTHIGNKETIDSNKLDINWETLSPVTVSGSGKMFIASGTNKRKNIKKYIFIEDRTGEVQLSSIIMLSPTVNYNEAELAQFITSIIDGSSHSFDG